MNAPCFRCDERYVGCHAKCTKYRKFQNENGKLKMQEKLSKRSPYMEDSYGYYSEAEKAVRKGIARFC